MAICPQCGAEFGCGVAEGTGRCWCAELPAVMPVAAAESCYCPTCLRQKIDEQLQKPAADRARPSCQTGCNDVAKK